jgi:hypothetical protein
VRREQAVPESSDFQLHLPASSLRNERQNSDGVPENTYFDILKMFWRNWGPAPSFFAPMPMTSEDDEGDNVAVVNMGLI